MTGLRFHVYVVFFQMIIGLEDYCRQ